jgi:hypothetical protein
MNIDHEVDTTSDDHAAKYVAVFRLSDLLKHRRSISINQTWSAEREQSQQERLGFVWS